MNSGGWWSAFLAAVCIIFTVTLFFAMVSFIDAKREISKYNKGAMESCFMLSCEISPFGDLSCRTLESATNFTANESYRFIILNVSGGEE